MEWDPISTATKGNLEVRNIEKFSFLDKLEPNFSRKLRRAGKILNVPSRDITQMAFNGYNYTLYRYQSLKNLPFIMVRVFYNFPFFPQKLRKVHD